MATNKFVLSGPEEDGNVPNIPIGKIIFDKLKQHGNRIAFIDGDGTGKTSTYQDILIKTIKLSIMLKKLGLQRNDVIALISQNSLNYFIPYLACLFNGFIVNTLNFEYTSYEFQHCFQITKPSVIFCSKSAFNNILLNDVQSLSVEMIILLNSEKHNLVMNMDTLLELVDADIDSFEPMRVNPKEQVGWVMMSSGTTGLPKAVMLTHNNLRSTLIFMGPQGVNLVETHATLCTVPYCHIFGTMIVISSLYYSTQVIFMSKCKPAKYLKLIESYKITKLFVVPTLIVFLIKTDLSKNFDLSCIKDIYSGSSTLSASTAIELEARLNVRVHQMYGMTETTGPVLINPMIHNNHGSVGQLMPHMQAKVIDENGSIRAPHELGELCIRGPSIMKGYMDNELETNKIYDNDGFLHTGDICFYDDNDYFYMVDRIKDIIKYKGFQVSPSEIEALLLVHEDVKDAAVVGTADESAGELPTAFIVKQNEAHVTKEQIIDFVKEHVCPQKRLHGGVIFLNEIPKNTVGKILRKDLKVIANRRN